MKYSVFVSGDGRDEITEQFKMSHGLFIAVCKVLLKEAKVFYTFRDGRNNRIEFKIGKEIALIQFWTTCNSDDTKIEINMFAGRSVGNYNTVEFAVDMDRFLEAKEQVLRTNKRAKAAQIQFLMEDSK